MRRIPAVVLLALAACGGPSKPTAAPPPPAKPLAWHAMNGDQRMDYMKQVVLPKTKAAFIAFDAQFQKMDCKTCHGPGADDGSFDMPNPAIKPLPNTPERFQAWVAGDADAAKAAKFMAGTLTPMVADLLGEQPFDPKTGEGKFSCTACHQLVDADGKIVEPPHHEHHGEHHHGEHGHGDGDHHDHDGDHDDDHDHDHDGH